MPSIEVTKYYKNKALNVDILNQIKNGTNTNSKIKKFSVSQFQRNKRWLLTDTDTDTDGIEKIEAFEKSCISQVDIIQDLFSTKITKSYSTIGAICDIGNGMVSGLDKAFQLNGQQLNENEQKHTIKVIKVKNLKHFHYNEITIYIYINEIEDKKEFQINFPNFYHKLSILKEKLDNRYHYNRKIHFWEWVFLRNYKLFKSDSPRIFVPCKERISNKNYFRFAYVSAGIFPTQDVTALFPKKETKESIYYILSFLNNHRVFDWLKNKGIVKGNIVEFSEKPISSIPFKKIDWNNKMEVLLHNEISTLTKKYLDQKEDVILSKINNLFNKLLEPK